MMKTPTQKVEQCTEMSLKRKEGIRYTARLSVTYNNEQSANH